MKYLIIIMILLSLTSCGKKQEPAPINNNTQNIDQTLKNPVFGSWHSEEDNATWAFSENEITYSIPSWGSMRFQKPVYENNLAYGLCIETTGQAEPSLKGSYGFIIFSVNEPYFLKLEFHPSGVKSLDDPAMSFFKPSKDYIQFVVNDPDIQTFKKTDAPAKNFADYEYELRISHVQIMKKIISSVSDPIDRENQLANENSRFIYVLQNLRNSRPYPQNFLDDENKLLNNQGANTQFILNNCANPEQKISESEMNLSHILTDLDGFYSNLYKTSKPEIKLITSCN